MPSLRIVLDPERQGLGLGITDQREVIHLADEAEIVISGLADGMSSGKPSMMFGFRLPDGQVVIAETSWRLFATAYVAFRGKFGEAEIPGLQVEVDDGRTFEFVQSEKPFVQCCSCSWRLDGENTEASVAHLGREYELHYRKKHRGIPPPPPFPGSN